MFRDWIRGCFFDPKLEEKAHEFADRANFTAKRAEKVAQKAERLVDDANRKLRRLNPFEIVAASIGTIAVFLVGCGIAIGVLYSEVSKEEDENKKEDK